MRKLKIILTLCCVAIFADVLPQDLTRKGILLKPDEAGKKVDVFFDGKFFTSYIYPASLEKPVLFPLTTSKGTVVSRGFPLQPRQGERVDHPHQVGWWFNYGDVNGLDFWNNSYAIPDSMKSHYGCIRHHRVLKAESGKHRALLVVSCQWLDHQQNVLLGEETSFEFTGDSLRRRIVRTTKLTAVNGTVRFGDNKEGLCALRVDRAFETPSEKPELLTDARGNPTAVPVLNNEGVNGVYRNSEGFEKDEVWGKRAKWVSLSAKKNDEEISIVFFDHPANIGFPAYWHARGYGLFSVNNLAKKAYNNTEQEQVTVLEKGESITFRHMLLINSGGIPSPDDLAAELKQFTAGHQPGE